MRIRGVEVLDTFAEAFTMRAARVVITAASARWAREAAAKMTGFATSVIGCKCEAGVERELPDGANAVLEIVLDGLDAPSIADAMRAGIDAACTDGVLAITAGNYGGKLG